MIRSRHSLELTIAEIEKHQAERRARGKPITKGAQDRLAELKQELAKQRVRESVQITHTENNDARLEREFVSRRSSSILSALVTMAGFAGPLPPMQVAEIPRRRRR